MDKVLLTTYRKLYRMCSRIDGSVGMRSALSCAPTMTYNHRRGDWMPLDVPKLAQWPESRIFLDSLIRRLNGGRQFYIPPATNTTIATATDTAAAPAAAVGTSASAEAAAASSSPATPSSSSSSSSRASAEIPAGILPNSPLRTTLRQLYETTAFSLSGVHNAFAAVKDLSYVCGVAETNRPMAVTLPEELRAQPRPALEHVAAVDPIHHVRLIKGLTEEVMESLRAVKQRPARRKAAKPSGEAGAAGEPGNAFDEAPSLARLDDAEEVEEEEDVAGVLGAAIAEQSAATPERVQLLLAHPQLDGFFRHSVLLVVRNAENEAAAFIINRPLENDEGLRMPVNATVRLSRVHPIFSKCLRDHTVMVGGPVMVGGAFDENVFLLHTIPDVQAALPIGCGLWLDGNYNDIMEKLQSGAAAPTDVVVVCGFSGWGVKQLAGEVEGGTWVVASGDAADLAVSKYVMQLAHFSGAHSAPMDDAPMSPVSRQRATDEGEEKAAAGAEEGEEEEEPVDPSQLSVRVSSTRKATASWVWAYDALGSPFAELATNQRPETSPSLNEQ